MSKTQPSPTGLFAKPSAPSSKRVSAAAQIIPFTTADNTRGYYCTGAFSAPKFKNRRSSDQPAVQPGFDNMTPAATAKQVVMLDSVSNPRLEGAVRGGVAIVSCIRNMARSVNEVPTKAARAARKHNKIIAKKIEAEARLTAAITGAKRKRQTKKGLDQDSDEYLPSSDDTSSTPYQPTLLELATPAPPQLKPRAAPQKKKSKPSSKNDTTSNPAAPNMFLIEAGNGSMTLITDDVADISAIGVCAPPSVGAQHEDTNTSTTGASPDSSVNVTPTDDAVPMEEVFGNGRNAPSTFRDVPPSPSLALLSASGANNYRTSMESPVTPCSPLVTDRLPKDFGIITTPYSSAPGTPLRVGAGGTYTPSGWTPYIEGQYNQSPSVSFETTTFTSTYSSSSRFGGASSFAHSQHQLSKLYAARESFEDAGYTDTPFSVDPVQNLKEEEEPEASQRIDNSSVIRNAIEILTSFSASEKQSKKDNSSITSTSSSSQRKEKKHHKHHKHHHHKRSSKHSKTTTSAYLGNV